MSVKISLAIPYTDTHRVLNCYTNNPYSRIPTSTHTYGMHTVDRKPDRAICNSRPCLDVF
jgi:hypothetical protein